MRESSEQAVSHIQTQPSLKEGPRDMYALQWLRFNELILLLMNFMQLY